jgi:hypothetical protein
MRAERFCIPKLRALPSAPEHPCFSLTEDLHGCRSAAPARVRQHNVPPIKDAASGLPTMRELARLLIARAFLVPSEKLPLLRLVASI